MVGNPVPFDFAKEWPMQTYTIKGPSPSGKTVECWSTVRLPFEPTRDWQKAQRRELSQALKLLEAGSGEALSALYVSSTGDDRFDAENVLFYNVGTAAFKNAAASGLEFEGGIASPPNAPDEDASGRHYHRYEVRKARSGFRLWRATGLPIRISTSGDYELKNDTKPSLIWHTMKSSGSATPSARLSPSAKFALVVTVRGGSMALNLATAVKPLFDGIISAFHLYVGNDLDLVSTRLAERLNQTPGAIANLLVDDRLALLDDRTVVHARGNGIQWNPKDDDCVAGAVYFEPGVRLTPGFDLDIEIVEVVAERVGDDSWQTCLSTSGPT